MNGFKIKGNGVQDVKFKARNFGILWVQVCAWGESECDCVWKEENMIKGNILIILYNLGCGTH